jgi:hypothetical protein
MSEPITIADRAKANLHFSYAHCCGTCKHGTPVMGNRMSQCSILQMRTSDYNVCPLYDAAWREPKGRLAQHDNP